MVIVFNESYRKPQAMQSISSTPCFARIRGALHKALPILAIISGLAGARAHADGSIADMFTYNGFGTAAIDRTDTDQAEYVRTGQTAGARTSPYFKTDSDLGLQGTVTPADWLSGTVQVLAVDRFNNSLSPKVEWAYLKFKPMSGLAVRFGEMALPTYMISDSRYVGFANSWIRPPDEVYGQATFDTFHGGDISYGYSIGKYSLNVGVLAGRTHANVLVPVFGTLDLTGRNVRGYDATLDADIVKFHWSYVSTNLAIETSIPLRLPGGSFTFSDMGVTADQNNVMLQAEFITRHTTETVNNTNGWYLLGGYHVGKFLPYAIYAAHQQPSGPSAFISPPVWLAPTDSHTVSIGMRVDVFQSVDVKLQFDHTSLNPAGFRQFVDVQPGFDNRANIVGIAADFVF